MKPGPPPIPFPLKRLLVSFKSAHPGTVFPSPNMSNPAASLVDQMLGRDAASGFVVYANEVRRQSCQFAINQNIGEVVVLQANKRLNLGAAGRDHQRIQAAPG